MDGFFSQVHLIFPFIYIIASIFITVMPMMADPVGTGKLSIVRDSQLFNIHSFKSSNLCNRITSIWNCKKQKIHLNFGLNTMTDKIDDIP